MRDSPIDVQHLSSKTGEDLCTISVLDMIAGGEAGNEGNTRTVEKLGRLFRSATTPQGMGQYWEV